MRATLTYLVCLLLSAITPLTCQESSKPPISKITILRSEPVMSTGTCKFSTSGYLEMNGKTKITKVHIGWKARALKLVNGCEQQYGPAHCAFFSFPSIKQD